MNLALSLRKRFAYMYLLFLCLPVCLVLFLLVHYVKQIHVLKSGAKCMYSLYHLCIHVQMYYPSFGFVLMRQVSFKDTIRGISEPIWFQFLKIVLRQLSSIIRVIKGTTVITLIKRM